MNFILLGKPGAGKGTICERLVSDGFIHLSTGDIFRSEIKSNSELGVLANSYISKGELVPDEVTNEIVINRIKKDKDASYLFDGYPRTVNQAECFKKAMEELGLNVCSAINLDISEEAVIKRLSSRKVCRSCGAIFNTLTHFPEDGKCDKCGGELYTRDDDKVESVLNRLSVYNQMTKPLIDYYKSLNMLYTFNSDVDVNELYKVVKKHIDEMNLLSSQNL